MRGMLFWLCTVSLCMLAACQQATAVFLCIPAVEEAEDALFRAKLQGITLTDIPIPEGPPRNTPVAVALWVNRNLEYVSESPDNWTPPVEALSRGYGDCEEFAFTFMNAAFCMYGKKFDLVIADSDRMVWTSYRAIEDGGLFDHALVRDPETGRIFDPRAAYWCEVPVAFAYTFDEVFYH